MQNSLNCHRIIITPNQQGRNVTNSEDHNVVELPDVVTPCLIEPFFFNDFLHHSNIQISFIPINILAKLGDEFFLVEYYHIYFEFLRILIVRYESQGAVKVFMKCHLLGHEALYVTISQALVKEAGWIRLSHELEEASDDSGFRRLLGQGMVHS
jgi:hypothetical protein